MIGPDMINVCKQSSIFFYKKFFSIIFAMFKKKSIRCFKNKSWHSVKKLQKKKTRTITDGKKQNKFSVTRTIPHVTRLLTHGKRTI